MPGIEVLFLSKEDVDEVALTPREILPDITASKR